MTKEALKLALEALVSCDAGDYSTGHVIYPSFDVDAVNKAIDAIDQALAQPEQKFDTHSVPGKSRNTHSRQPEQDWIERERAVGYREGHQNALKQMAQPEQEPLEYWNAVEGWVKIDEVREHFDSVGCGTIYKTAGEGREPLYTTPPQRSFDYKEHAEGLQRDYDLLLAEYNLLKQDLITVVDIEKIIKFKERNR